MLRLIPLLLAPTLAFGNPVEIKNDGFSGNGQVGFQSGFVDGECWASVFFPPEEGIDFEILKVEMLVYGSSPNGFYNFYVREVDTNSNNEPGDIIAETYISLQSASASTNEFVFTGAEWEDAAPPGLLDRPFAISVCLDDENGSIVSTIPQIARDTDGTITSNLNWIYSNGWYRSSLFGLSGDWIMRATIDGDFEEVDTGDTGDTSVDTEDTGDTVDTEDTANDSEDTSVDTEDTGEPSDSNDPSDTDIGALSLLAISPNHADAGRAESVTLTGAGFVVGSEARIGGVPLTGATVSDEDTIVGTTSNTLPPGVYDVEVVGPDGANAVIIGGFTVNKAGCGCQTGATGGLGWALPGLLFLLRRRQSSKEGQVD